MKAHLFLNAPKALLFIDPFNNKILQLNNKATELFGIEGHVGIENNKLSEITVTQFFMAV